MYNRFFGNEQTQVGKQVMGLEKKDNVWGFEQKIHNVLYPYKAHGVQQASKLGLSPKKADFWTQLQESCCSFI